MSRKASKILPQTPEERVPNLALPRFRPVLISASSSGSTQIHLCAILLASVRKEGTLSIAEASAGSMNPGKGALTPIAAGSLCWNAMGQTRRIGSGSWTS